MSIARPLQPDQDPARWVAHVADYEAVFEPLTDAFALAALDRLEPLRDTRLLDVAAGTGGAALEAAARGACVVAVDASPAMAARLRDRARAITANVPSACTGDGMALSFADSAFDAALSCLGVVLFPEPARGMAELHRVLRPGGRVAIVTWTEPHRYELAARLRAAIAAVRGAPPEPGELPAQLRFTDPLRLYALVAEAGFDAISIARVEAALHAPSARALAGRLGFAPGMEAMLAGLGPDRAAVIEAFAARLEADQGMGAVTLAAVAHVATGIRRVITSC